jgi:hypothetical protein
LLQNAPFESDKVTQFTYYKPISDDKAIVLLQNPSFWSNEVTKFPSYKHISIDVAIV